MPVLYCPFTREADKNKQVIRMAKDVDARWTKKRDETFYGTSSILKLRNAIRSYFLI